MNATTELPAGSPAPAGSAKNRHWALRRYRIVVDEFSGFEVQVWRWYWPFWVQCSSYYSFINTHSSIEAARKFAARHAKSGLVVEYISPNSEISDE